MFACQNKNMRKMSFLVEIINLYIIINKNFSIVCIDVTKWYGEIGIDQLNLRLQSNLIKTISINRY